MMLETGMRTGSSGATRTMVGGWRLESAFVAQDMNSPHPCAMFPLKCNTMAPFQLPLLVTRMNAVAALAMVLAASTPSARANGPWDGTWKLDRAKSHLTGHTITLSRISND